MFSPKFYIKNAMLPEKNTLLPLSAIAAIPATILAALQDGQKPSQKKLKWSICLSNSGMFLPLQGIFNNNIKQMSYLRLGENSQLSKEHMP